MSVQQSWMYQDPERVAMSIEAKRVRLTSETEFCKYRVKPIFEGDKDQ